MNGGGLKTPWTVLLLTPDYEADTYGQDSYLAHVEADGTEAAVREARMQMAETFEDFDPDNEDDLFVIAVFAGHHQDVQPA